jgi:hypothetical protein
MNVKELRIGNYAKNIFGIIRIEEIPLKSNPLYNPGAIDPLPLTEDMLIKAGFELLRKSVSMNVGGELFNYAQLRDGDGGRGFVLWNAGQYGWTIDSVRKPHTWCIQYVHQLQNLYFALMGTELEINL